MCGINGIVNLKVNDVQNCISNMNKALAHRGPDAQGIHSYKNIFLGHTRLSILDLSTHANQPFISEDENFVLVFNGEVYNYKAIKSKYNLDCTTSSDTEVILKAFIKTGPKIFEELNGMFAIAILDKKNDQVFLARDKMGIKPLFVFQNLDGIAFSSELNALKSVSEIKNTLSINNDSVFNFLNLGYIPGPHSIYNEITKFPSGTYAVFKNNQLTYTHFWNPKTAITKKVISDEKTALNTLDELLNDSVQLRLNCDVPFGTFLSGGIDSSLVSAIAQKKSSEKIDTFSIGFKEKSKNEAVYAKEVAQQIGSRHHEFYVTEKEAFDLLPEMFTAYGEPYADSSAIPTMMVSKMARQEVKMTLSGDGGDELFHGYGFYNWAKRLNHPLSKALKTPLAYVLGKGNNKTKRVSELFKYKNNEVKSHIFSQEQYYFSSSEIEKLVEKTRDSRTINFNKNYNLSINSKEIVSRPLTIIEQQSLFDIQYYLKDELLVKVDIASMQNSLEDRVPLLDSRIVEFALNLDPALKIKNGEQKYILKKLLYQYLPSELFNRPKQGFSIPLSNWLKGDLKYLITDYVNEKVINECGLVNWETVNTFLTRFYKGEDYLYTRIWALIVLHKWFLDNA